MTFKQCVRLEVTYLAFHLCVSWQGNSGMQHTAMHGISEGGSEGAQHSAGASMDPAVHAHAREHIGWGPAAAEPGDRAPGVMQGPPRPRSGSRSRGGAGAVHSRGGGGAIGGTTAGGLPPARAALPWVPGVVRGRGDSQDGSESSSSGSAGGSGGGGSARGDAARRVRSSSGRVRKVDLSRPCLVCRDVLGVKRQVCSSVIAYHR